MPAYPLPKDNPFCECAQNPMKAFFCQQGHMLECHAGYGCDVAGCSHLSRYDFEPDEVAELEAAALERLKEGLLPPYSLDAEGQVVVVIPDAPPPAA